MEESINKLVEKIKSLPYNEEFVLKDLMDELNLNSEELLHTSIILLNKIQEENILLECKNKGIVGLPYNLTYIKLEETNKMNMEIITAREELTHWLSDPHELGHIPYEIEYTNSFSDEDEIKCLIFKYKKEPDGIWLLGIVSDSGTFSEMKEYNEDTETSDAKKIVNMLKEYWKNLAKQIEE